MESYKKDFIFFLYENNCILKNKMLKSGRISPIYFNFGGELYQGKNIREIGKYYANALHDNFDIGKETLIFGPAMKGIPLVTAISYAYYELYNESIRFAYNRQIEKKRGEGGKIVGPLKQNDKIIIIDDVFTTGDTKKEVIDLLQNEYNAAVYGVLIGIDRKEKDENGKNAVIEFAKKNNLQIKFVITIDDVLLVLEEEQILIADWKKEITEYRKIYGC